MKFSAALSGALVSAFFSTIAVAQDYPTRPVTWVVPFTPGGVTDSSARIVAKALSETLGTNVIIENKPGAGAMIGTEAVAQSKPDGYTILFASSGPLATNPYLYKKISYDPVKSFSFVHTFWDSSPILVVNPNTSYKTLAEFIDFAKKNPEKINIGSAGTGTNPHLIAELLQLEAGIKLTHIPYKGTSPMMTDLLAGTVDATFDFLTVLKPLIDAGKLRPLAVSSDQRLKQLPNVPTLKEAGYPKAMLVGWSIITAAADTPQPIVDKLSKAFGEALKKPEVVSFMETNNLTITPPLTGEALKQFVISENAKFKVLVEKSGAKAD